MSNTTTPKITPEKKRPSTESEESPSSKRQKVETTDALKSPEQQRNEEAYQRLTRTRFFLAVCELLRQKSSDPCKPDGCCLVRSDTRQLQSIGYNGFLVGENNDPELWKARANQRDSREDHLQHAETNAIHFCSESDLADTIAYVSCLPCHHCCAKLIQKRVAAVVFNVAEGKQPYIQTTKKAFEEAGIYAMSFNDVEGDEKKEPIRIQVSGYENNGKEWEVLFMAIAFLALQRCEGEVTPKAGCVIVKDKQILGYGYSGYPQLIMKKFTELPVISAIQNALCFTANVSGATVYCTHFPKLEDVKEMIQRGIALVKYCHAPNENNKQTEKVIRLASQNPISLQKFTRAASRVENDADEESNSVTNNVPTFNLKVQAITWTKDLERDFLVNSIDKTELVFSVPVPEGEDELAKAKEARKDMDKWLKSTKSMREIKAIREQKKIIDKRIRAPPPMNSKEQVSTSISTPTD